MNLHQTEEHLLIDESDARFILAFLQQDKTYNEPRDIMVEQLEEFIALQHAKEMVEQLDGAAQQLVKQGKLKIYKNENGEEVWELIKKESKSE